MSSSLIFIGGVVAAALGSTIAVAAAAVSRLELTRWISRRLRGAAVASAVIARPSSLFRISAAISTVGMLAAGMGFMALVPGVSPLAKVLIVLAGGLPFVAAVSYAVPRAIGQVWSEPIVRGTGPWMQRLALLLRPLMPGSPGGGGGADFTEVLRVGSSEDLLQPGEASVIAGVLEFTRRPVREVMTPRTEVVALREGSSIHEVGEAFAESGYSRLPIYRNSLDHIVGMVHAFDLLKVAPGGELPIRPLTITPGSKPSAELLLELQRERRHLAVVLDEFGGTAGIVTLQDLLELLVGDIFEEGEPLDTPQAQTNVLELDGAASSSEVANAFDIVLPQDSETIGGLLAREAGRIPSPGDRFTMSGLEFDVLASSPTRIERIAVRRGPVRTVALTPPPHSRE